MITFTKKIKAIESTFGKGKISSQGNDIAVSCPKCSQSKKKKLSISLTDNKFNCWVCGYSGKNIGKYISRKNPEFKSLFEVLCEEEESSEEVIDFPSDFKVLTEYFNKKYIDPDIKMMVNYLKNRGITKTICEKYAFGFSKERKFYKRIIIPSFDCNGNLNYYTARSIDKDTKLKYLNARVKRADVIFNEINIDYNKKITLVEGPMDSILGPENSVSLLGSFLTEKYELFKKIIKNKCDVRIILDSDAKSKQDKIADLLYEYGINVTTVDLVGNNDIADIFLQDNSFESLLKNEKTWERRTSILSRIDMIVTGSY
tara:strand:+ start:14608 stop:15552 length:945 start_codon:yes stop_codon:yes gene_type:complete